MKERTVLHLVLLGLLSALFMALAVIGIVKPAHAERAYIYNNDYSKREAVIIDKKYIYTNDYTKRIGIIKEDKVYNNKYERKYNIESSRRYDGGSKDRK